jgi:hypothetical protein
MTNALPPYGRQFVIFRSYVIYSCATTQNMLGTRVVMLNMAITRLEVLTASALQVTLYSCFVPNQFDILTPKAEDIEVT